MTQTWVGNQWRHPSSHSLLFEAQSQAGKDKSLRYSKLALFARYENVANKALHDNTLPLVCRVVLEMHRAGIRKQVRIQVVALKRVFVTGLKIHKSSYTAGQVTRRHRHIFSRSSNIINLLCLDLIFPFFCYQTKYQNSA